MAMSQAAYAAEKAIGHGDNAITEQDITNPAIDRAKYADPSGETMKALVWMGKNDVKVGKLNHTEPKTSNRLKRTLLIPNSGRTQAKSCRIPRCYPTSHW